MVVMTESWNEQRLDDLNRRVDSGFVQLRTEMNEGFAQVRGEMNDGFAHVRGEMNEGLSQVRAEIGSLQRTLLQVGGGLIGTVIAAATAIAITLS